MNKYHLGSFSQRHSFVFSFFLFLLLCCGSFQLAGAVSGNLAVPPQQCILSDQSWTASTRLSGAAGVHPPVSVQFNLSSADFDFQTSVSPDGLTFSFTLTASAGASLPANTTLALVEVGGAGNPGHATLIIESDGGGLAIYVDEF